MLAYAAVLTNGFALWRASGANELNLTSNSMLEHLLRGQYDVDPNIVGTEGYLRDGRVYAYWGVFCALLRLPLTLIPGGLQIGRDPAFLLGCGLRRSGGQAGNVAARPPGEPDCARPSTGAAA
jgi:hypothetical protein